MSEESPQKSKENTNQKRRRKRRKKRRRSHKHHHSCRHSKSPQKKKRDIIVIPPVPPKNNDDSIENLLKLLIMDNILDKNLNKTQSLPNLPKPPPNNTPVKEKEEKKEEKKEEPKKDEGPMFGPNLFITQKPKSIKFYKPFTQLTELIDLGETYDPSYKYECNINMKKLHHLTEPLKELNNMIGLTKFKKSVIDQLIFILTSVDKSSKPMLHTVIYGEPGLGKTHISKILAKIYASCGLLSKGGFKVTKREDYVSGFLGQTALKTKELLNSNIGNVVFIDEVYSFGGEGTRDYFAKEAIDTINVFLSEHYEDFIMIIAGYEKEVKKYFFSQNPGLERRFTQRFIMEGYNPEEMSLIFKKFIKDEGWNTYHDVSDDKLINFFRKHKDSFPYYGGDIKTLFDKCKVNHMRKLVMLDKKFWKKLSYEDVKEGFDMYLEDREVVKEKDTSHHHMYI